MSNFIIYKSNGQIIRTGFCPEDHLQQQIQDNEFLLETTADEQLNYVDVNTKEIKFKATKPTEFHIWNYTTNLWEESLDLIDEFTNTQRQIRDQLLSKCDWVTLADSPLTAETKALWLAYRQALRDVPAQTGFPLSITWPVTP